MLRKIENKEAKQTFLGFLFWKGHYFDDSTNIQGMCMCSNMFKSYDFNKK